MLSSYPLKKGLQNNYSVPHNDEIHILLNVEQWTEHAITTSTVGPDISAYYIYSLRYSLIVFYTWLFRGEIRKPRTDLHKKTSYIAKIVI